jgi:CheY-like chemotaxis protein
MSTPARRSRFVLAIEDDPAFRDLLRLIVEGDFGATMASARDGEEGIALAGDLLPDLILLDVILPGADGVEVCRQLKASSATHAIPILGLTAAPDEALHQRMLAAGVDAFVHKFYAFHTLLPLLVTYLGEPAPRRTMQA